MPVIMNARCDNYKCRIIQSFCLEGNSDNGSNIIEGLREGGWTVEGEFDGTPTGVKLRCPVCTNKKG